MKISGKRRADLALVEQNLVDSRARAQAMIMAGLVFVGDRRIDKPGQIVAADAVLRVKGRDHPWVSRGGVKLAHALDEAGWDFSGDIVLDVGASTGGFTEVALSRGAARVYAVDVGHGQLAWSLRQDPRVVVLEKTNARHLTHDQIPDPVDVIICDASFISLRKVLVAPLALAAPQARLAALIKPQFEAAPAEIGKGGVVRDVAVRARICDEVWAWVAAQPSWQVIGVTPSPILGPSGNAEFVILAHKRA